MDGSIFGFAPMVFWLALAIILAVFEIISLGLTTIWFALGGLVAFLGALAGFSIPVQIILFIVVSVISLLLVRPFSMKYLNNHITKTNIDSLIGRKVKVTKEIDNIAERGTITLDGTVWNARSETDETIAEGETVSITRVEGNKLYVTK